MKPLIAFPIPQDSREAWETFRPFIKQFCETMKQFPGDCDVALLHCGEFNLPLSQGNELFEWLYMLPQLIPFKYPGNGCDIGSAQWLSHQIEPDRLMIMMTTRCYLHRAGWLERYVEAHQKDPDALLGASASWEGGKPHICTRAYAMRAGLFASYPHLIDSREKGTAFECGDGSITDWFYSQERHCIQVTFDGEQEQPNWRNADNIYRKGDQSAMLVHDRHTDLYRDADDDEKARLEKMANPPIPEVGL